MPNTRSEVNPLLPLNLKPKILLYPNRTIGKLIWAGNLESLKDDPYIVPSLAPSYTWNISDR